MAKLESFEKPEPAAASSGPTKHSAALPPASPRKRQQPALGNAAAQSGPKSLQDGHGVILPNPYRETLARELGGSLERLRIHPGAAGARVAAANGALAVSKGRDVWFGPGAYRPETSRGRHILRHEAAHYVQRYANRSSGVWGEAALEAEAEHAAHSPGRVKIQGRAAAERALRMKTYVSTKGSQEYLDKAKKFYQLWEGETSKDADSFQTIVEDLATVKKPIDAFRIVSHANDLSIFLPLLSGADTYANKDMLGLQRTESLTAYHGEKLTSHVSGDMVGTVHAWMKADPKGKALLESLDLSDAFTGLWKELVWWEIDRYFVDNNSEKPAGPDEQASSKADIRALKQELIAINSAINSAIVRTSKLKAMHALAAQGFTDISNFAAAERSGLATLRRYSTTQVDTLRSMVRLILAKNNTSWSSPEAGSFRQAKELLTGPDRTALRLEIGSGQMVGKLSRVKNLVGRHTHIEIRGCNIGNNTNYLNSVRTFFGTQSDIPSISAPKMYQFFGTPGLQLLPVGSGAASLSGILKFLFDEGFIETDTQAAVQTAVDAAGLKTVGQLADVLRHADIKAEFERWWKTGRKKALRKDFESAPEETSAADEEKRKKDFEDKLKAIDSMSPSFNDFSSFLQTRGSFPVNAPGMSNKSLWFLFLLPDNAVQTLVDFTRAQGYRLPGGGTIRNRFFRGMGGLNTRGKIRRFGRNSQRIFIDWLGDKYPVPDKILFPQDPEYEKNIKRLP